MRLASTLTALATVLALALASFGCKSTPSTASIPSNQMTPVVYNQQTRDVLLGMGELDAQVLASALEQNTENGSCIYVDHAGFVYNPDGSVFLDPDGKPLRVRTRVIAKLNSLKSFENLTGVKSVEYEVGGYCYLKDLPEGLKGKDLAPCALRLKIDGIDSASIGDTTAANREAAAKEREAIFKGMSELATAKGAAFATRVEAIEGAAVSILTAAGKEIVGRCLGTAPIEAAIAGATKIVEAKIDQGNGTVSTVLAEGEQADALTTAAAALAKP